MIRKLKDIKIYGLFFTIASTIFVIVLSAPFFTEERLEPYLYNAGIDSIGALICAALFYGCMIQDGSGIKYFRNLIILVCSCFVVNEVICFTVHMPDYRTLCFVFCFLSKLIDLVMIYLFYLYVRESLGFEGKLARFAEKFIPIKILINDHAIMGGSPAEILERVNKQVCTNNDAHMFVTVWLGILEISTGLLTTASAGHEYPIININGKYELLKDKHGFAIGVINIASYKNTEIRLKKGDSIFVYTDGVAEATDAKNELFGTERTVDALNALPEGVSQKEVLAGIRAAVDAFVKEAPQFDDLMMLGLKYNGSQESTVKEEQ